MPVRAVRRKIAGFSKYSATQTLPNGLSYVSHMKSTQLFQFGAALAVALLPFSTVSAQAADGAAAPRKGMNAEERLAKMKTKLDLTDDQVTKIKTIFDEQKAALEPIFKDTTLTKEQKREKVKPIIEATKGKVDAVLTPEQKVKAEEARKKRQEKKNN
jgi:Spy/CpxP family protein refolding chaperone